jgi:transposase-like protein
VAYSTAVKTKAIALRLEKRASIEEIHQELGVSQGALSLWLREHPLTDEEQKSRQRAKNAARRKPRIDTPSKLLGITSGRS